MEELRSELISLAVRDFQTYLKDNSKDDVGCLYDMPYIRFAKEMPRLFCFLFMRPNAFSEIRQALQPMIEHSVQELMDTYPICHEEADLLHDQLWMHAHGIASMIATDFCDWDMEKAGRMLADCKHAFTKQYKA